MSLLEPHPVSAAPWLRLLHSVLDAQHDPCVVLDPRGCVLLANRAFVLAFGVAADEVVGRPLAEIADGAWDVPALRVLLRTRQCEPVDQYPLDVDLPGRGRRALRVNLRPLADEDGYGVGWLMAVRDATEARDGEHLAQIVTDAASELVTVHGPDGALEYASPSAEAILGYTPDELVRTGFLPLLHADDEEEFRTFFEGISREGRSGGLAYRLRRCDGSFLWLGTSARAVRGTDGGVAHVQMVSRDVTERKEAEEALRHSRWLAGIGQTVLTLRHEINNPLASMLADATLLEMEGNSTEEEREMVRSIVRQARRIRDVVHRLAERKDAPALRRVGSTQLLDLSDTGPAPGDPRAR